MEVHVFSPSHHPHSLHLQPVTFETKEAIYHTNVMMSIGTSMAVVCADSIVDGDRARVLGELKKCGKMVRHP